MGISPYGINGKLPPEELGMVREVLCCYVSSLELKSMEADLPGMLKSRGFDSSREIIVDDLPGNKRRFSQIKCYRASWGSFMGLADYVGREDGHQLLCGRRAHHYLIEKLRDLYGPAFGISSVSGVSDLCGLKVHDSSELGLDELLLDGYPPIIIDTTLDSRIEAPLPPLVPHDPKALVEPRHIEPAGDKS